ncbi:MAG TPA: hypothetical protein VIF43_02805 [Patescibacteria group bacterium]|jgi:hypothetical protein
MIERNRLLTLLKSGLAVLAMTASFAIAPQAEAVSAAQVNGFQGPDDVREAFKIDGNDAPKFAWRPSPPPKDPTKADPDKVSVFVCEQTVSTCTAGTPGAVEFRLTAVHHEDRGTGLDNWDFTFSPYRGDTPIQTPLKVIYRINTDGAKIAALVWGDPGDAAVPDNLVAQLNSFDSSEFAKDFLDKLLNDKGLQWAEKGEHVQTSTNQSSLIDRAASDPFSQALEKMAEIITSLIGSVTSAVEWALDAGTLMDNQGVADVWMVVRDLVNVLFILVLSTMAFMSILRLEPQKYNIRSLLPLLVFSVIGVNFSFLFASIMANTAAVLSQPFLERSHDFIQQAAGVGSGYSDGLVDGFGEAVVLLLASLIILVALIILLFFLVVRIIVIWVLAILSPVVFLFLVLPLTRGESRNLLKNWIQWVYMAPIAMLLLFAGSLMLRSTLEGSDTGDPGGSAILQAIFFAGIVIAAVMVPIGMGGRIAQLAGRQGSRLGKGAGKGGLGAVGLVPLGRGMTVGEAARTGRAFLKQRTEGQEERAQLRAAGAGTDLYEALEDAGVAGVGRSLTGFDSTQAQSFRERLVDKELKDMQNQGIDEGAMRRIVAADMGKTELDGEPLRLSSLEQGFAESRTGSLAAVKGLSQQGWFDWEMLPKYARTGYHKNMADLDPLLASVKKSYRGGTLQAGDFDRTELGIAVKNRDGDGMRKIMASSMEYARNGAPLHAIDAGGAGQQVWRQALRDQANATALGQNMNLNHRNVAVESKRLAIASTFDQQGGLQRLRILQGMKEGKREGFVPLAGGPQAYDEVDSELDHLRTQLGL